MLVGLMCFGESHIGCSLKEEEKAAQTGDAFKVFGRPKSEEVCGRTDSLSALVSPLVPGVVLSLVVVPQVTSCCETERRMQWYMLACLRGGPHNNRPTVDTTNRAADLTFLCACRLHLWSGCSPSPTSRGVNKGRALPAGFCRCLRGEGRPPRPLAAWPLQLVRPQLTLPLVKAIRHRPFVPSTAGKLQRR